jgi:putative DNA primase/helicase
MPELGAKKNAETKAIYDKGPSVHKGEVYHSDMAEAILNVRSFLTLDDTKQILWYDYNSGIYRFNGETIIEQLAQIWLGKLGLEAKATTSYINQVVDYIRRDTYIDRNKLNYNPRILVVKNGVYSFDLDCLVRHSKVFRSTIAIPVTYDENATCPAIEKFISEIVAPNDVPLLYEIIGWCLTKSNLQRLVLLLGEGSNGKSVFLNMLRCFLGETNCTAHTLQSLTTNRFAVAGLYGKLANISPDLPSKALREAGPLKTLTGLDTVEAEKKFKDSFNFINHAKMLFAANIPPDINEDTYAIWRRFIMVDFPNIFAGEKADKNLLNKLTIEKELSGLLNKALEGLRRLEKNSDFSYSRTIEDTRSKYLLASNPAMIFIEEHCVFNEWAHISKENLYQAFMKFCGEHKVAGMPKKAFGHKIKRAYYLSEGNNEWRGIELASEK